MAGLSSTPLEKCERCPRLVALRREVRETHPDYHAAPVPAWGTRRARLLLVGLAPGMHGANRTGRPFTGDASGDFLFRALHRAGFADSDKAADALLTGCRITNAVKCLPPQNRPVASEITSCTPFLVEELAELCGHRPRMPRVVLCLGRLAHEAVVKALVAGAGQRYERPMPEFAHGRCSEISPRVHLLDTYHPSRQNTNTGRLTLSMLDDVMVTARQRLGR